MACHIVKACHCSLNLKVFFALVLSRCGSILMVWLCGGPDLSLSLDQDILWLLLSPNFFSVVTQLSEIPFVSLALLLTLSASLRKCHFRFRSHLLCRRAFPVLCLLQQRTAPLGIIE